MRIAALQCNFEKGRTLAVADRWKEMGFNVEQVFHPMADSYSALFDIKLHGRLLKNYLGRLKKNSIRAILYLNVHILGPALVKHKDDWAQRTKDGKYLFFYESYYPCCINSPWRDYYFSVLENLAPYEIDGVFLDGPVFIPGGCHCRHCRKRYEQEEGRAMTPASDRRAFYRRSMLAFLRESYQRFKRIKPAGIHYMNMAVSHPTAGYLPFPDILDYNDIVGTEGGFMFYGPPKDAPLHTKPGLLARISEAVAPAKPRVIFMAADQTPWPWLTHTPVETRLCIAGSVANGSNIWYGLHGSTRLLDTPGGRAGKEMIRFLARNEDVFDSAVSDARVGLMYSYVTERSYRSSHNPSDFYGQDKNRKLPGQGDFFAAFQGMGDLMVRASIPFDVVTDLAPSADKFRRYQCLILPTSACLDEKTMAALREYAAQGGHLISACDTSLFDEQGNMRPDFGLADIFNVHFEGRVLNMQYFKKQADHPIWDGLNIPLFPAPELGLVVKAGKTAKVLARYLSPMASRYIELTRPFSPAMVLNRYGKGRSLYLAGTFGEMMAAHNPPVYQQLLENALKLFVKQPVSLEGALGNVEMIIRRQSAVPGRKARRLVHLVNHAGLLPRPYRKIYPQNGLKLRIHDRAWSVSTARALAAGCSCAIKKESGSTVVILPELREYEIIALDQPAD